MSAGARGRGAPFSPLADQLWEIGDILKLVEDAKAKPGKRGPYNKRNDN